MIRCRSLFLLLAGLAIAGRTLFSYETSSDAEASTTDTFLTEAERLGNLALLSWTQSDPLAAAVLGKPIGSDNTAGCLSNPKKVDRLQITSPGIYENYLVDSNWQTGNRVKIDASGVTLRHCEIRNASGNGIGVFADDVLIESCRIHHMLRSTYLAQADSHGITGRPKRLVIRNCEIYYVSGDAVQFDPGRSFWDDVLIENCTFWTGPLPADAGGFNKGERPGENAFDSKTPESGARCRITFRNCYFHGWKQPGQVGMLAALNLKENVDARVENCVFNDNQVGFRLRGPASREGALVSIRDCAIYNSDVGVRMEDNLENLSIDGLLFGDGVVRKYQQVGGGPWPGYTNVNEGVAPPLEELLLTGFDSGGDDGSSEPAPAAPPVAVQHATGPIGLKSPQHQVSMQGVTKGNLLVLCILNTSNWQAEPTITDDRGNVWVTAEYLDSRETAVGIAYTVAGASGNVTINAAFAGEEKANLTLSEVRGQAESPLDATASIRNGSGTTHYCAAAGDIDTSANVIVFAAGASRGDARTIIPPSGHTVIDSGNLSFSSFQTSSAPLSDYRGEWTTERVRRTSGCLVSFKAASAE